MAEEIDDLMADVLERWDRGVEWDDIVKELKIPKEMRKKVWGKLLSLRGKTMKERHGRGGYDSPNTPPPPTTTDETAVKAFEAGAKAIREGIQTGMSIKGEPSPSADVLTEAMREQRQLFQEFMEKFKNQDGSAALAAAMLGIGEAFKASVMQITSTMQAAMQQQRDFLLNTLKEDKAKLVEFLERTHRLEQDFLKQQAEAAQAKQEAAAKVLEVTIQASQKRIEDIGQIGTVMSNFLDTVGEVAKRMREIQSPDTRYDQVIVQGIQAVTQTIDRYFQTKAATGAHPISPTGATKAPPALPSRPKTSLRGSDMSITELFKQAWEHIKQVGVKAWLKAQGKKLPDGVKKDIKEMLLEMVENDAPPLMFVSALHEILAGVGLSGYTHSINTAIFSLKFGDLLDILDSVLTKQDRKLLQTPAAEDWWRRVKATIAQGYSYAGMGTTMGETATPNRGTSG